MIERLLTTLGALAAGAPDRAPDAVRALADDCADAVRLTLDCPQHDLSPAQRDALRRLGNVLDEPGAAPGVITEAARSAAATLGLPATSHDR